MTNERADTGPSAGSAFTTLHRLPHRFALHALWIATALTLLLPSTADPDLWGHVLFGRTLLAGTLPTTNGLSYTAAEHAWVNHEILAEAAMAAAYDSLGPLGLVVLKTVLGLAALSCVWAAALRRTGDHVAAGLATTCVALVLRDGLMIRPQLFSFAFLAATLAVLAAYEHRPRGWVWGLPIVAVLWTNTHGGVLAGIGLAAAAVGARTARDAIAGTVSRRDVAATLVFGILLGAALFVNPYGARLPIFLLTEVTPHVPIREWAAVAWNDTSFLPFKMLLIATIAWSLGLRRVGLPEALVLGLAAAFALMHRRHIPLFAIAAAPVLAALLADLRTRVVPRLDHGVRRAAAAALVAVAVLQSGFAAAAGVHARGRIDVDPRYYPVEAMRFLAQNAIGGNVALPFRWGEYGLWALPAGSKVAVDGRFTTSYPAELLEDAWRFMEGSPGWDALLTEHPTDVVVADRAQAPASLLRRDPEWQAVYADRVSVVFLRKVPSQADALARFDAGALHYDRSPLVTEFPAAPHAPSASATLVAAWTRS